MNALNYNDEKGITTGLLALLSLVRKYEFEMDEDREPLYGIFGQTSAKLGALLDQCLQKINESEVGLRIMQLICKVFYASN
jgi:hypothetical protein